MRTKKTLIAVVLSSLMISAPSFSEEFDFLKDSNKDSSKLSAEKNVDLKLESATIAKENKAEVLKNDRKSLEKEAEKENGMKSVLANVDYLIDPDKSISQANELNEKQHELDMYKLDLEKAIAEQQLNEIIRSNNQIDYDKKIEEEREKWEKEKKALESSKEEEINALKFEVQLREQMSSKSKTDEYDYEDIQDRLFVTKVYGIGRNMSAKIYFDNKINSYSVGDEVIPGAKILKVDINGVLMSYNKKLVTLSLTTVEHATYKTFELSKKMDELSGQGSSNQFPSVPF